jgi:hypothetical protein
MILIFVEAELLLELGKIRIYNGLEPGTHRERRTPEIHG